MADASGATVDSGSYLSVSRKSNAVAYVRDTANSTGPLTAPAPSPPPQRRSEREPTRGRLPGSLIVAAG
jgi:hypothetical protein